MPFPPTNQTNNKEENFEAISPQRTSPMLISTTQSRSRMGGLGWLFFLLFLLAAAASGYLYLQFQKAGDRITELEQGSATEQDQTGGSLTDKLSRHMVLPIGDPKVTDITDADSLRRAQPLYYSAHNGDQLVTFTDIEIVYDPEADKIVHVRNITGGSASPTPTPGSSTSTPSTGTITVDVRNGAGISGLAAKSADVIKALAGYQVKSTGNAAKTTYNTTLIINLTGKNISALEKQYKTTALTALPLGEANSTADVVVILGKNQ